MKKTSLLLIPFFFCLYLIFIPKISVNAQCIGSGCPGGSGGTTGATGPTGATGATGTVSSAFTRTGAVVAASGDYTEAQITPVASRPGVYSCSTSAYSDPGFTCTTGAALSGNPLDGSLIIVKFVQACTDFAALTITVDSLASKQILSWDGTSASTTPLCSSSGQSALLRLNNPSGTFTSYSLLGFGQFPICSSAKGILFTNSSIGPQCSLQFSFDSASAALNIGHLKGDTSNTTTIAAGTAAGSSPTISLTSHSNDIAGQINVTPGITPSGTTIATITFGIAYGTSPFCSLTSANSATQLIGSNFISATATGTFTLSNTTTALTPATPYSWWYHCTQ